MSSGGQDNRWPMADFQKHVTEARLRREASVKQELCDVVHPRGYRCAKPRGHEGNHAVRGEHHCHATGCGVPTQPEMLMCRKHWFLVPKHLRARVWATYRAGQCDDKRPSEAWFAAANAAIKAVAEKEGK